MVPVELKPGDELRAQKRILIVDDVHENCKILKKLIKTLE